MAPYLAAHGRADDLGPVSARRLGRKWQWLAAETAHDVHDRPGKPKGRECERRLGGLVPTDGVAVAITDATLIVRPERARAQRAAELPAEAPDEPGRGPGPEPRPSPLPGPDPQPPSKTRFFGSKRLQADRYASDFKKLADEILSPLGATLGVTLNVTVEIEAVAPDGFDDAKVRTVSENAATLKFEQNGFEEG